MGLIHIEMFATLDLVGQAPGGPDEDPEGFPFGGWQAPLLDEVSGAQVGAAYEGTDALLLGRRTYDIFAAYWPHQQGGEDGVTSSASPFAAAASRACSAPSFPPGPPTPAMLPGIGPAGLSPGRGPERCRPSPGRRRRGRSAGARCRRVRPPEVPAA